MKLRSILFLTAFLSMAASADAAPRGGGGGSGGSSGCTSACNILDTVCRVIKTKDVCDQRLKDCKAKCTPTSPVFAP